MNEQSQIMMSAVQKIKWMLQDSIGSQCVWGHLGIFETFSETLPSKNCFHNSFSPSYSPMIAVEFSSRCVVCVIITD